MPESKDDAPAESKDEAPLKDRFRRFVTKNPMWVKALENFVANHTTTFDSEEEHKHAHYDIFVEYQEMVDVSLGLFLRKHKCSEAELADALTADPANRDLVDVLVSKGDFATFAAMMKSRKLKQLTTNLDALHSATTAAEAK